MEGIKVEIFAESFRAQRNTCHVQGTRYEEPLRSWLRHICLVWDRVLDLAVYISNIKLDIRKNDTAENTPASVSSTIKFHWEYKKQGSALRVPKQT